MLGVNPAKVGDDCQALPLMLYSQPDTMLRVILVAVLLFSVGLSGAVCVALETTAVVLEDTLPVQLAAVTVTLIVWLMSASAKR